MKPFRQHIVLLVALLGLTISQAQGGPGFVPGQTPPFNPNATPTTPTTGEGTDPLAGAGSLDDTLGSLGGLLDNFTWDGFIDLACKLEGEDNEEGGVFCDIASFYNEVKDLAKDNETTIDDVASEIFSETSLADLALGFLSPEQQEEFGGLIEAALRADTPQERITLGKQAYEDVATAQWENYQKSIANGNLSDTTTSLSPVLQRGEATALQEQARIGTQTFQAASNTKGSSDIANAQVESTVVETMTEGVKDVIAPAVYKEAQTAVSTRATIQEVVSGLTKYMAQDADQFAYLSYQLTLQSQQQVYSTHSLQLIATSLLNQESEKVKSRQAAINAAITNNTNSVEGGAEKLTGTLRSWLSMKGGHERLPRIQFNLN
jgi:hypothetical protein